MARDIDSGTLAQIEQGAYPHNWLLLFDLPSGLYGFHLGHGPLEVNGQLYVGAGSLIGIEAIGAGIDLAASPLRVTLRAVPESALTPDVLATVDNEAYKNRPVTLSLAYFNRATGAVANVYRWWSGYVDTIQHNEQIGGEYVLTATLEPRSLDHSRRGFRMRSDADQKLLDPTDRFFEHAATTPSEELPYGRASAVGSGGQGGQRRS